MSKKKKTVTTVDIRGNKIMIPLPLACMPQKVLPLTCHASTTLELFVE
jgi:hypothetical protein